MPTTEVLLVEHIANLGAEGDVVKVRPGYARNFLLPQNKAVPLNMANKKRLDALKVARAARETDELQKSQEIASRLKETKIAVAVKTGAGGKLFGSVTVNHILEKLQASGFVFDKKHVISFYPIKQLGKTTVKLSLHKDVDAEVEVEVVSENPIEQSE